ncbi:PAS domain S-box protein [Halomontanus rarus]|uniref:PAS domain S-box protein n=1 Tax=Halomontanus rarus TaxID=3034020 RepID=UPI0023E7D034|nr:PAS domain S-box protein [Halovivax sp. TS33]
MSKRADATETAFWTDDADDTVALQRYRTLVQTVDDGIYQLDAAGRFVAVNNIIVEMTGYTRDELLGEHVSSVLEDDDVDRIGHEISKSFAHDESLNEIFELTVGTADSERRYCELRVSLLVEDGTFRGSVGVVRDITDRKRTKKRLDDHKQQLDRERDLTEQILETSPVGILVLDANGEVTRINERCQEILDISDDELGTYYPSDRTVYDENDREIKIDEHPFAQTLETGEPVYDEVFRIESPNDVSRWISVNAAPVLTSDGETDRVVTTGEDVTELKEHQRRLEQQNDELSDKLEEIHERITDGFAALNEEWEFTHVNDRAEELLGFDRTELLGTTIWEVFPDVVGSTFEDRYREAMETQESRTLEEYDPELEIWFKEFIYPSETGLSVYFRDVSEQKEHERKLRESEQRYRTLVEYFPNGLVTLFDHDLKYTLAAGKGFDRIPVDPADLEGRQFDEVWPDETVAELDPAFKAALDGDEMSIELEYADREWVFHAVPITDERGDVFAGMTMAQDITDRKRAELKLQRSNEQLQSLVEILPVGVVVADQNGGIIEANNAATKIWGGDVFDADSLEEYDALPVRWADTREPVERDEWTLARVLQGEEITTPRVFEIEAMDGERRVVSVRGMPIRDERGEITRGVITLSDITDRREYQCRLEETIDQLEASNERLEHFAYAASHDLQEPLRMVSSYLQLIENRYTDVLDEDGEEFLEFAIDGADRMREMIDSLLEYSRIETQGNPFEPTELETVFADLLTDLQFQLEESGAEIHVEELPCVNGDAHQLRQVFQNLLHNAIEYAGDEPPQIHVSAEQKGQVWEISVRDEGVGIEPENTERIFEVFERLHDREDHSGMGIGLALCQRIVERHGGDIQVNSKPGEGATFSFTLPACPES